MDKAQRAGSANIGTAAEIQCALPCLRALTHYVNNGLLEIDNSSAEVASSRRHEVENYFTTGSDSGAANHSFLHLDRHRLA